MVGPLAFTGTVGQMFHEGLVSNKLSSLSWVYLPQFYPLVSGVFLLLRVSPCHLCTDGFPW